MWWVIFEWAGHAPVQASLVADGGPSRANVEAAFASAMHAALRDGGCRGFTVSVHQVADGGAGCDHEGVPPPRKGG